MCFVAGTSSSGFSHNRRKQRERLPDPRPSDALHSWSSILETMETIRITTDTSRHAGCGGLLGMSEAAPLYIVEHEGLETRLPGVELVCLTCGERIRSQDEVEIVEE